MSDHSCGQHMFPQRLSVQPQKNPPNQKPPRAVSPEAACVSDHSCGQPMLPQQALKTNSNSAPPLCVVPKLRLGMRPAKLRFAFPPPQRPSEQTTTAPYKTKKRINPRLPRRRAGSRRSSGVTAPNGRSRACERIPLRHRSNLQEKNNIVIPEFSAWLTLVLEQCRAENIRNLPRQRAPTPLFPERRPREACSMPISGCHDLPLATFNRPSRNNLQNKPNSAATMSLPCSRFATAPPQRRWDAPLGGGDSGYFHSAIAK